MPGQGNMGLHLGELHRVDDGLSGFFLAVHLIGLECKIDLGECDRRGARAHRLCPGKKRRGVRGRAASCPRIGRLFEWASLPSCAAFQVPGVDHAPLVLGPHLVDDPFTHSEAMIF